MKTSSIISFLAFFLINSIEAQYFGKNDLGLSAGFIRFDASSLNNKDNSNGRRSRLFEVDKHFSLKRRISLNTGLGLGNIENLDKRFNAWQSSDFFRVKIGVMLHGRQNYGPRNWSPRRFNPFVKIGYNIDFFDHTYQVVNGNRLGNSVRMGLGAVIKINHYMGLTYEFSHNQRLISDYRTYFQHNIGLIINMDQIYVAY